MAKIIPPDVQQFTTEGEKRVYNFFSSVAKPDNHYIVWYTPNINDMEPDFVLYSEKTGVVIFEVKDWTLEQIERADPDNFYLKTGEKTDPRKNPQRQAKDYLNAIIDKIRRDKYLVADDPIHHGNPKIPLDCGVIFTNINRHSYLAKGLDAVIDADKIFFWDDLHPSSDICADTSGHCFATVLEKKFPPKFPFSLNGKQVIYLKQLMFPVVRIEMPERMSDFPYEKRQSRLNVLDHHQEAIARRFDRGHQILTGPPGSGKTLILIHKAAFLRQYNPDIKTILFVCFNVTLAHYIKRLLVDKRVPLGHAGVEVIPFFGLCSRLLGEDIAYEGEDTEYYEMVVNEALGRAASSDLHFDAILIDEGQDFSDEMFAVVLSLLNKKTDNLTIALDDDQNIYQCEHNWEHIGIKTDGRVHEIWCPYRNTVEITEFAQRFIQGKQPETASQDFLDFHGPKPEMREFADLETVLAYVADRISQIIAIDRCPYSEIAVLYSKKNPLGDTDEEALPNRIMKAFESKGILSYWVSENYRAKSGYDITTNRVAISTIHSAKGLDYACVFILGLDFLQPETSTRWSKEQIDRLVYVGLTRARYQLIIPYVQKGELIDRLLKCL